MELNESWMMQRPLRDRVESLVGERMTRELVQYVKELYEDACHHMGDPDVDIVLIMLEDIELQLRCKGYWFD